jgi:hypothetical protein
VDDRFKVVPDPSAGQSRSNLNFIDREASSRTAGQPDLEHAINDVAKVE